jgi:hypothetical protein
MQTINVIAGLIITAALCTAGCNNHSSTAEGKYAQPKTESDSTDKWFEQYTKKDSVEVIFQGTEMRDSVAVNSISYIDYSQTNPDKKQALQHEKDLLLQNSNGSPGPYHGSDTLPLVLNPFKELNGSYCRIGRFNQKLITQISDVSKSTYTITDTGLVLFAPTWGDALSPYDSAYKKNNVIVYTGGKNYGAAFRLEIKISKTDSKLQAWKFYNSTDNYDACALMAPLKYALNLPAYYSINNYQYITDEVFTTCLQNKIGDLNEDSIFAAW